MAGEQDGEQEEADQLAPWFHIQKQSETVPSQTARMVQSNDRP